MHKAEAKQPGPKAPDRTKAELEHKAAIFAKAEPKSNTEPEPQAEL